MIAYKQRTGVRKECHCVIDGQQYRVCDLTVLVFHIHNMHNQERCLYEQIALDQAVVGRQGFQW